MPLAFGRGRGGVEGGFDDGPQLEGTGLEGQLARDDPRGVEEVVDELGQGLGAALDHPHGPCHAPGPRRRT
jgi:hypothetical protein